MWNHNLMSFIFTLIKYIYQMYIGLKCKWLHYVFKVIIVLDNLSIYIYMMDAVGRSFAI